MSVPAAALARRAVLEAGFSAEGLRPLRVHSNAVFLPPRQRVVVRVGGGADAPSRADRAVACTRWLVGTDFPAVSPVTGVEQPLLLADEAGGFWAATFWHQVHVVDRPPAAGHLGHLLHWLHSMPAPPFDLPPFRPLDRLVAAANATRDFDHWLQVYQGTLPSASMRWCTKNLKLKPLEEWLGDSPAISYVAIRADENRLGYVSTKPNIKAVFPFREDDIDRDGVNRILDESGIGLPAYYEWRTRSGCYFCFFQRKHEWVGLADRHPELFEQAIAYEDKVNYQQTAMQSRQYTWSQGESLRELIGRRTEIEERHEASLARAAKKPRANLPLIDVLADALDEDSDEAGCAVCHI